jgi:ATP-dependent protease ClpP protease subunit
VAKRQTLHWAGDIDERFLCFLLQRPAKLILCSAGGDMYIMTAAIDFLLANPTPIHATGQCMSAAVPILACGSGRTASPMTRLMVHPGKILMEAERGLRDIRSEHGELRRLEKLYADVLGAATQKPAGWWAGKGRQTMYFSAAEAAAWGVIDEVTAPKGRRPAPAGGPAGR